MNSTESTWVHVIICLAELLARLVAPEANRYRGMRTRDDKLARLTCVFNVVSRRVEDLDGHPETFSLKLCVEHAINLG